MFIPSVPMVILMFVVTGCQFIFASVLPSISLRAIIHHMNIHKFCRWMPESQVVVSDLWVSTVIFWPSVLAWVPSCSMICEPGGTWSPPWIGKVLADSISGFLDTNDCIIKKRIWSPFPCLVNLMRSRVFHNATLHVPHPRPFQTLWALLEC